MRCRPDLCRCPGREFVYLCRSHLESRTSADWVAPTRPGVQLFSAVSPRLVVPDNLKSGVTKSHRYEPVRLTARIKNWRCIMGWLSYPARAGKPRDKAKVESGVLVVERWILARLRHQTFLQSGTTSTRRSARYWSSLNQSSLSRSCPAPGTNSVVTRRPTGPQTAPSHALRVCGVEESAGEHRLSHRRRRPLLLRALSVGETASRGPADDRGSWNASRKASA